MRCGPPWQLGVVVAATQLVPEHSPVTVIDVAGGGEQGHTSRSGPPEQLIDGCGAGACPELLEVSASERLEAFWIVTEPAAQVRAGGDVTLPRIEHGMVLGDSARPQPVDEDPSAVAGCRACMDPAQLDSVGCGHGRRFPCQGVLMPAASR